MSLLRHPRTNPPIAPETSAHEKIEALQSEIKALRPARPPTLPPAALPVDRSERALFLLAEMARQQLSVGQRDEARRTVGDALLALGEIKDEISIARASVLLAESLITLDAPQHAKPRLQRAVGIFDRIGGDGRWGIRARIALGRTLVALDDIVGLTVLGEARIACMKLGEMGVVAQIDVELREAEKTFDTPRHVHTGYGRPVSTAPPGEPIR